jgi:hypothetical protein
MEKKTSRWWNYWAPVAVPAAVCLALRLYNIRQWLLANLDEVSLMNNLTLPIFSGGYGSTTFFPAAQITNWFPFITTFPEFRFIGVLFNAAGLLFFYAGLRTFCSRPASFMGSLLFSLHWYLVYISRIYEIATFIPFFFSIVFYLFCRWVHDGSNWLLPTLFFIGGIGLNCYAPPMAYGLAGLWLILIYKAVKKQISWPLFAACILAFAVAILPFLYVQIYVGNFFRDVLYNYNMAGATQSGILPIHLKSPSIFFKTLTEMMTFLDLEHKWQSFALPALLVIIAPFALLPWRRTDKHTKALMLWTGATLALTFISPVAAYIQGHFTGFLILYLAVLSCALDAPSAPRRWMACTCAVALAAGSFYWMPIIRQDQYREVAWLPAYIQKEQISSVPISDGAYLVLKHTPFLQGARFPVFYCQNAEKIRDDILQNPDRNQRLIIATLDCDIDGAMRLLGGAIRKDKKIITLLESYLANGIIFYFVEPGPQQAPH